MYSSRRSFVKAGAAVLASVFPAEPLLAFTTQFATPGSNQPVPPTTLSDGWQYYQGSLDPRFQVWNSKELITWEPVTIPHCFNHYDGCDPEVPAYRGPGWYRTKLPVSNPFQHGRTLLHFEAAGQRATVFIGTEQVGHHEGGYDEFVVDITEACRGVATGSHIELAVLCDNSRNIDALPSDLSDFTLYGGLYRPVHLVYVPAVSIEAVHTEVTFGPGQGRPSSADLRVSARLYAPTPAQEQLQLELTVSDPAGNTLHHRAWTQAAWTGELELAHLQVQAPQLWSPDTPALYLCSLQLTSSHGSTSNRHRFGIRHTRFEEHGPFYLNGERLLLRGTHRHEDHAGYAAAVPEDIIRREMTMIKEMGANFIRLAHYQQRQLVLDLCDELGIFVWEEVPWCRSGVGSPRFQEQGRTLLRTMLDQHRNHPSILLWGLGNEDDWPTELNGEDHAAIRRYMQDLRDLAHSLDKTRLTSYRRCEFAQNIPDVYSPSIWAGWYSGRYTEYGAALEKARSSVPHFIHMEWGADSHTGRHAEDPDPVMARIETGRGTAEQGFAYKMTDGPVRMAKDGQWTETYACELFDWYLKTIDETPWLTGAAQWIFKDFTTPLRVENPIPRINQKGLVERDLTPKEGYFVFQSRWAKKPMVHIYGHSWPVRWGAPGQKREVRVYSNCKEVELFLNGASVGTRTRNPATFPACGLTWQLSFREGPNELHARARTEAGELTDSVALLYQTKPWSHPTKLQLSPVKGAEGSATVEALLLDENGVLCLDSRAVVSFSLAGEGRLVDNLGTAAGSRVVQLSNGRARISLLHHGPVEIVVTSAGVAPALLRLP